MWRPGNWENPYAKVDDLGMYVIPVGENNITNKRTAYEAGADAMLEVLKEAYGGKIKKDEWTDDYTFQTDSDGILISFLIPDDEEGKDEKMDT